MSVFQTVTPSMQNLDPLKRVNYTFGLVLGVDEFLQEQTYLLEKDHSQYRLAHGYGTVCGLQVRVVNGASLAVQVTPGLAINPQGQEIRVQREMCARLNDWLTNNKDVLQGIFGAAPASLSLCVVLCYRECPTDLVPVPGEPCRTQQDATDASRIAESFQLKLCLNSDRLSASPPGSPSLGSDALPDGLCFRPSQIEDDAIRQFGKLLRRIRISDSGPFFVARQQLEDLVRDLAMPTGSPPISSPPWASPTIYIHPDDADDFLRAAFLVWVTEVRPSLSTQAGQAACGSPDETCVLLGELDFTVDISWQVTGSVSIDETRRPFLLQSRLLQESLLGGLVESGSEELGRGPVTSGAGTFNIIAGQAVAAGATYNGLSAKKGVGPGTYVLQWSGAPAYVSPLSSPPDGHTYVVNGTAIVNPPSASRVVFEVLGFQSDGILVRLLDTQGNPTAAGFTVEIKELAAGA